MRIAMISNFLTGPSRGGAERYAAMLAASMAAAGHDVTLYTGVEGEVPGVRCHRLPGLPELDPSSSTLGKAGWHLREQWLPAVHRALALALRTELPDVVHSHEPQLLSAAVFTAIAATDLPHVHTAHDFNLLCTRATMTKAGEACGGRCLECRFQRSIRVNAIRRRLDLLLAPSDFVRERHLEHRVISPERAVTIRQGAPPGRQRLREPTPGRLHLGFLGAIAEHKGIRTLLRTAANMPAGWSLTLAGTGPLAGEVRAAAARDSRIAYVGVVGDAERDTFLDGLDVLIIPSEWEEPAPLVAVEAAVRGLPAIVSDRGGLPETPQAAVFRGGDPQSLLRILEQLDIVPDIVMRRSKALLDSSASYEWSTHLEAVEGALQRAAARS